MGVQIFSPVSAQPIPIQVTDVEVPTEAPQAFRGQVKATIHNLQNRSYEGFTKFTDDLGEIASINPLDPTTDTVNFTIGAESQLDIVLNYEVSEAATLGLHLVTFEVNVGGFSFLYEQYDLIIVPVATVTAVVPGEVFQQGQPGALLVVIENYVDRPRNVRLEAFGPNFINATLDVELAPGQNNIALTILHNATTVYNFGMFPVNVSLYYNDELIDSHVAIVPVDMTLINKILAIILPTGIFLLLVIVYAIRKRRRLRAALASE